MAHQTALSRLSPQDQALSKSRTLGFMEPSGYAVFKAGPLNLAQRFSFWFPLETNKKGVLSGLLGSGKGGFCGRWAICRSGVAKRQTTSHVRRIQDILQLTHVPRGESATMASDSW